ncbi:FtsX-like permease family protein [Patescibacteria group bacterium]|nr:MAG: FtsX-like permease family protein [Patescibacteria group bacterium]
MIWENLKMAGRSIMNNKLRSFLTMLGIIIGVGAVSAVIAIGNGVKASITNQVDELGTNLIQVNPGQGFTEEGGGGAASFASSLGASTLTEKDVATISGIDGVAAVAPAMLVSGAPSLNGKVAAGSIVFATTGDYDEAVKTEMENGHFLDTGETKQAVIGSKVAESLFGSLDVAGKEITLRNQQFRVVGVTKKPDSESLNLGPSLDSVVYIQFEDGKTFNNGTANINEIEVKAADPNRVGEIKQAIKDKVKVNHDGESDFSVSDAKEQLKVFDSILAIMTSFVAGIAGISLLVGGIGIMNIMLVSVTERTREIGLRKAIGATSGMVLSQFLIEAVVLTLLGGVLGLGFAWLLGLIMELAANIKPVFTVEAVVVAFSISTIVGIIFGIAPAIKAARMKPIDALRYE